LGGQASLRALEKTDQETRNSTELRYVYSGAGSARLAYSAGLPQRTDAVYISALTASKDLKLAATDNWGNIKVPRLEGLGTAGGDTNGWLPVPQMTVPEQYSSYLGIPVVGLPSDRVAEFTMEISYMSLTCSRWEDYTWGSKGWVKYYNQRWKPYKTNASAPVTDNDLLQPFRRGAPSANDAGSYDTTFFLDTDLAFDDYLSWSFAAPTVDRPLRRVQFGSVLFRRVAPSFTPKVDEHFISVVSCAVAETHAEVGVKCTPASKPQEPGSGRSDCRAVKMRRSLTDVRPNASTPLDISGISENIITYLPLISAGNAMDMTLTERVLFDTTAPPVAIRHESSEQQPSFSRLTGLAPDTVALRLGLILNSYY
jgi:hypothetical protein